MDPRLEQALELANFKLTAHQQKENLKMRLEQMLTFAHNGGIFKVNEQLISFVDVFLRREINEAVLIDTRGNPVKVANLQAFHDDILSVYFEATNEYNTEYDKLRKARSVKQASGV